MSPKLEAPVNMWREMPHGKTDIPNDRSYLSEEGKVELRLIIDGLFPGIISYLARYVAFFFPHPPKIAIVQFGLTIVFMYE